MNKDLLDSRWSYTEIKRCCSSLFAGGTPDTNNSLFWDGNISWVASGVCHDCDVLYPTRTITEEGLKHSSTKLIPAGTTILAMTGATCGNTGYLKIDACANQSVFAFVEKKEILNSRYLFYFLQALKKYISILQSGGAQGGINGDKCKNLPVLLPPLKLQEKIAIVLDSKIRSIERIISVQELEIQKIKKYEILLIDKIVAQGFSNAKLKSTNIPWIGYIPENWKTIKIKFSSRLKGRIGWDGLKSTEFVEEGPYLITGTDFENGEINWSTCAHISENRFNEDTLLHIKENDLLITKDGTIGKLAIVKQCPEKVSLNSGVMIIRNTGKFNYHNKYLYYVLQSNQFKYWYELSQSGNSTIRHLYQGQFYNFEYSFPPYEEQVEIADYLDKKVAIIDQLITMKKIKIDKLQEYKNSIIYEYVTGKKEVNL